MIQFTLLCLFHLVPCTLASPIGGESWENFTNNLATDLAPLITLFGDQVTKQFLSESISLLDNVIFALSPLGILTAVVSVIRLCGSSSLRAFIGRAQEGPADAESELLSCVSESTQELFRDGGISRVFGRSKIVEIFAWEKDDSKTGEKFMEIGTLREALLEEAWSCKGSDNELWDLKSRPELDIPNLSLNKGIKRKSQLWFYCAAVLGALLQIGVIVYAALTVFVYPTLFKKHGRIVPSYAFPLYIVGTTFLFIGMFFCAFIIERSSKEYYFHPKYRSKIYWLQPGGQQSGDQVFGSFLAVSDGPDSEMTTDMQYIKSIKVSKVGKYKIYPTLQLTMVGFVLQFIGLRSLHSSIIMAQLASTLVMAIVRTCLRTERMAPDENILNKKRDLVTHAQKELDYFAFHFEGVNSFNLLTAPALPSGTVVSSEKSPRSSSDFSSASESCAFSLASKLIRTRVRLAQLTSSAYKGFNVGWDDLPTRQVAYNLTDAIQETMNLLSSWTTKFDKNFEFKLFIECEARDAKPTDAIRATYAICLSRSPDTLQWRMDAAELEAVLGLWTWSLTEQNNGSEQSNGSRQPKLYRLVGLSKTEAGKEETDLYFHKWIFRQTEARMLSSRMIDSSRQFFGFESDEDGQDTEILVVQTENDLETMAAQDIYIHFLSKALEYLTELGGEVDVVPGSQNSFLAHSSHIDELVHCFETCNLGTREDALLCIVPALKYRGLLPELAADSANVRKRTEAYIRQGNWKSVFQLVSWICERSADAEFERSVYEMGYLCRRAMLESNDDAQKEGFRQTCTLISSDIRLSFFENRRLQRPPGWMTSPQHIDWWHAFSRQLGWIAWHISVNVPSATWMRPTLASLNVTGTSLLPAHDAGQIAKDTENGICALEQWLTYTDSDTSLDAEVFAEQIGFEWALRNEHYALTYWVLVRLAECGKFCPGFIQAAYKIAAQNHSHWAIQVLLRHNADIETLNKHGHSALVEVVEQRDLKATQILLENGASANGNQKSRDISSPLIIAAQEGLDDILELLLKHGAAIEIKDSFGITPLQWACRNNRLSTVRTLLSHGAKIDVAGADEQTPLLYVVANEQLQMAQLLLDNGANMNARDMLGNTPLMRAARLPQLQVLCLLLDMGAPLNLRNKAGSSALDIARELGHAEAVAVLLRAET